MICRNRDAKGSFGTVKDVLITVFTKADAFEYGEEEELFAWLDVAMNANERT